jgi:cytochrome P450
MRLYPPAWVISRQASETLAIGGNTIEKGQIVLMSQWITHHDSRWWPRPNDFNPDRWLSDDPGRPRYAYFPFSGGIRGCVGEAFAWLEMILVVATVLQKWELQPIGPMERRLSPSITLRPRDAVQVRLLKRR